MHWACLMRSRPAQGESLDEESLEQALKALTSLADGKRLVGIISHVSELKERIENKIIVTKKCGGDGVGSSIKIQ